MYPKIESIDNFGNVTIFFPKPMQKFSCQDLFGSIKVDDKEQPNLVLKIDRDGELIDVDWTCTNFTSNQLLLKLNSPDMIQF